MTGAQQVTVLGAGVVGACCALALRRDGHDVTLIDRGEPGRGCSFGNAGIVQIGGIVPIASPDVLRQVPRMLADPDGALIIRWRYLLRLMPYLARFIASARPARLAASTQALASVLGHATAAHRDVACAANAQTLYRETGELYVYHTEAGFETARAAHALRARYGVRMETVPVPELREFEPDLGGSFARAVWFPDCISTIDPLRLTRAIVDAFCVSGGKFVQTDVRHVRPSNDGACVLETADGARRVPSLVLAGGAWSKALAKAFNVKLPLDTERGYHLMFARPGVSFRRPVVIGDAKVGLSSMEEGLRVAGTAELASLDAPPDFQRAYRLRALAQRAVPALNVDEPRTWMGQRPSTPDSLPVIGTVQGHPNVHFAFGHGHLGLTLGPLTGQLVADLVMKRRPVVSLAPFSPGRF